MNLVLSRDNAAIRLALAGSPAAAGELHLAPGCSLCLLPLGLQSIHAGRVRMLVHLCTGLPLCFLPTRYYP